jgi:hypothetical protein
MGLKSLLQGLKNRTAVPCVPFERSAQGTLEPAWIGRVPLVPPPVPLHFLHALKLCWLGSLAKSPATRPVSNQTNRKTCQNLPFHRQQKIAGHHRCPLTRKPGQGWPKPTMPITSNAPCVSQQGAERATAFAVARARRCGRVTTAPYRQAAKQRFLMLLNA